MSFTVQNSIRTFTELYKTDNSVTLCTITIAQRFTSDPFIIVKSPDSVIDSAFYRENNKYGVKSDSLSTMYIIDVSDISNSSFVDYINAIALCVRNNNLDINMIVAATNGVDIILYRPVDDSICYSIISNSETLETLKDKCLNIVKKIKC